MTTSVQLDPDSLIINSGWTRTGGSNEWGVLADASDATFMTGGTTSGSLGLGFTTTTLPAGARCVGIAAVIRAYSTGASQHDLQYKLATPDFPDYTTGYSTIVSVAGSVTDYTVLFQAKSPTGLDWTQAEIDAIRYHLNDVVGVGNAVVVTKLYLVVAYAAIPVVVGTAPSSPVSTTTKPTVTWSWTPDSTYPTQERYQVRVFTAAEYGIDGFDPETSPCTWDSGVVLSPATTQQITDNLDNGVTYRAYIRAAAQVNGAPHWSLWDDIQFTMSLSQPGAPTFAAHGDSLLARNVLDADDTAGSAGTDYYEFQRSLDSGTTWTTVRDSGLVTPGGLVRSTVYDYDAPNGTTVSYRVRAISTDIGPEVAGPWSTTRTAVWSSPRWCLKAVGDPTLMMFLTMAPGGVPVLRRPMIRGVFGVLGRADPIVTEDIRRTATGRMVVHTADDTEGAALRALLTSGLTLLLQAPAGARWGSRYVRPGDHEEDDTPSDDEDAFATESVELTEVAAP